jgi:predicted metal-dependent enzyme (double-stranded beta helix superfamily)
LQWHGRRTAALVRLAARSDLFPLDEFPLPAAQRVQLYEVGVDSASGCALYAVRSARSDHATNPRPHNHETWVALAAVHGNEHQEIYDRVDDGAKPGWGALRRARGFTVQPGSGIGLLPDEYHSIDFVGDGPFLCLHFYGRRLDTLTNRIIFSSAEGGRYERLRISRDSILSPPTARA